MAVKHLDVSGITNAAISFRNEIHTFDDCVISVDKAKKDTLQGWIGKGRNQFETQMGLMMGQLNDISEVLYEIYDALIDAETGYIDVDEETAKQFRLGNE